MRINKSSVVVLAVVALFVAVATFVFYIPQNKRLNDLAARSVTMKRQLKEKSSKASVVPELFRQISELKSRYRNFDRSLPKRQELGGFLREIAGHLADKGLSDQVIEPGNPSREELFHTLPIIMRFKGSYLSLGAFLEEIDQMERLTRVQKLNIHAPRAGSDELDIKLQLNIYFNEG